MRRLGFAAVAGIALVAVGCSSSAGARSNAGHSNRTRCVVLYQEPYGCYLPGQISVAEGSMLVRPVRPSGIVYRIWSLKLGQVDTLLASGQTAEGQPSAEAISYVFGQIPAAGLGSIPSPAPPHPRFVVVSEMLERTPPNGTQLHVARTVEHNAKGKRQYDPWNAYAYIPERNLRLDVVGNVRRASVRKIAVRILAAGVS